MIAGEAASWTELLQAAGPGDHFAQIYKNDDFLCEAVAEYAAAGLRLGEAVFIVATPAHRADFLARLGAQGTAALEDGQLVLADAEACLARIRTGSVPDW